MARGAPQNLIDGPIARSLWLFTLPTLGASVFQSLNASINMIWIGRFLGESALSATSNATNIIFLVFSSLFGFGMAATVLIGQHFGRGDLDGVRRAVGAAAALFVGITIILLTVGVGLTDKLLHLMGTPPEAAVLASAYMKMMVLTLPFNAVAMLLTMTLRGIGDALTPLRFMVAGIVIDIILNPLLIAGIGPFPELGIVGSAVATLVSNAVSAFGLLIVVYRRDLPIRLRGAEFRYLIPQWPLLRLIVGKGTLMGLQMFVFTLAGLIMVGLVNHGGINTSAAFGVAFQLWNYIQMPAMAVGSAVSTMVAQNIGAGRWDRVSAITRSGVTFSLALTAPLILLLTIFDRPILGLFLGADSPAMPIAQHIQIIAGTSFLFIGVTMVLFATVRANGSVLPPLLVSIVALLVFRVNFARFGQEWLGFDAIWWAFPISSLLACLLASLYYRYGGWRKNGALADVAERAEQIV